MRYFLTGATGFIGGRVARRLVRRGDQVTALVRTPAKAADLGELGITLVQGDITDRESMRAPMSGADGVFHIAAWYKIGARNKREARTSNVDGTRNVLELMRDLSIPKGVYTSTLAVYSDTKGRLVDEDYRHDGPWISEYDRTKWAAHYEVAVPMMAAGLPLVIVQPGVVYGPGDTSLMGEAIERFLRGKLPAVPKRSAYCFSHVDDIAEGHLLAMDKGRPGESYNLAGPQHTMVEFFEAASRITGIRAPRMHPGPALLKTAAAITGAIGRVVPLPETYSSESLRVSAGATYLGSNAKARRELGFDPRSIEEGLRETLVNDMQRLGIDLPQG
jgi:nucleoside-diphosphate-sugar epimerase